MKQQIVDNRLIPAFSFILGLSICTSTALMSAAYCLIIVAVMFRSNLLANIRYALTNKFVLLSFIFYLFLVLASLWSIGTWHDSFKMLSRIHGYLFAPLFYVAFITKDSAKIFLKGFLLGATISVVLSILSWLFNQHILYGIRDNSWVVFHGHILHNAFLAVASAILLLAALSNQFSNLVRITAAVLYSLCLVDILFIVVGRTGQIIFVAISLMVLIYRFRLRSIIFIVGILSLALPLLYFSPAIRAGVSAYNSDMAKYHDGDMQTSVGNRFVFHDVSMELVKHRPILGYGTGGFTAAYTSYANVHSIKELTTNPHRDILWVAVEGGIVAAILFVLTILAAIYESLKLSYYAKGASLIIIIGYLIASLQNSFFIDNVTGMAFIFIVLALMVIGNQWQPNSLPVKKD